MSSRLGVLLAALSANGAAYGQGVQEITVTAERIETILRRTPVSAVVIDANAIDAYGITQLSDLTGRVPGVVVPNGFSNQPQAVAIRGVGASQPAMAQAVGVYVDDVPLVRGYGTALWDLPDLEQIEVLRGPQGTLHGQNSTAGAIKLVSLRPTRVAQAWGAIGAGSFGTRIARGYATGPLGEGPLAASVALSRRTNDGFGYNATSGRRVNQLDTGQARAKLQWSAPTGSRVTLAADVLRDRSDTNTQNFPLNHPAAAPRRSFTAVPNGDFQRDAYGVTLTGTWPLDAGVELRSISAWRRFVDDPVLVDVGGLETQRFGLRQRVAQTAVSQELQLRLDKGSQRWTFGALVQTDEFDFHRFSIVHPTSAPAPIHSEAWTRLRTTDAGAYGNVRIALDDRTSATVGLRAWRTAQEGSNEFWRTDAQGMRTAPVYDARGLATHASGLTPRLSMESRRSESHFIYGSISQGAKFGGFNRAAESERSARVATRPERVTTVELGSKARVLGDSLDLSVALFHNKYKDLLASVSGAVIDGTLVPDAVLLNAGRARTWGGDVELAIQLAPRTRLVGSVEVLRSRLDRLTQAGNGTALKLRRLPNAPTASAALTASHGVSLSDLGWLDLAATVRHVRPYFTDLANSPQLATPEQTTADISLSWRDAMRRWSVTLLAQNAFGQDRPLLRTRIPPLGVDSAYWSNPRTVTVMLRFDI
jgi:iron complex outermembrane receptor protein